MDYDAVMLYLKDHPDATSLDLSREFGVTVAKAFTFVNKLVRKKLVYKTIVKSPTNGKKIFGYRVIDGFDEVNDNPDGSMPTHEIKTILRRLDEQNLRWLAAMHLAHHNEWRRVNGVKEIPYREVFNGY